MGKSNKYLTGKPMMSKLAPGEIFANLTVVKFVKLQQRGVRRRQLYLFRCVCGTEVEFLGTDVYRERIKSCGCIHDCGYEESAFRATRGVYEKNAMARNLDFQLDDSALKQLFSGNCHYCASEPSNVCRKVRSLNYAIFKYNGIDRVNNDVGYISRNCVSCCRTCVELVIG